MEGKDTGKLPLPRYLLTERNGSDWQQLRRQNPSEPWSPYVSWTDSDLIEAGYDPDRVIVAECWATPAFFRTAAGEG